jgi:CheY-like chemotaxis protein
VSAGAEAPARVLMVDDRPDNLLALEAVLDSLGAELIRAGSGEEALRALLSGDFAVIILDVQMPGMDGFETAQLIKARDRTRNVPIIFLTAISGEAEHHLQGYRSGAVDYVYKPFSPEALRAKVAVFLELWRQSHELDRQRAAGAHQLLEVERLNRELERSNAALERMASAAAAEIQQPLDNVAGLIDLIVARHGQALGDEAGMLMTRTEANVAEIRARVASLLEYARLSSEGFELEPVHLADVVDEAAGARAGELAGAGVTVVTGELPEVRGDRAQLVKLFGVLLDNAIHHGGAGPLTVRVEAAAGAVLVTVTVVNDGEPIPAEVRPRLFSLLPLNGNGTDGGRPPAGLTVARRIVEGHGGAIWCGSPEAGASLSFTLPAARP